ncbi:hypothetical protein [Micromonospora inaquosa]|uniref:Uncharacterized protein n=1 Tax=Micromonospora inaquosa TaxID=2203716 RepID=A0A3N9WLY8_9ACTN|nr:hypothetical protein [Micromonospora inaquosa]RQX01881.1 hypothetical protein DLJ59_16950 [Micromonospora inaquosa]
MSAAISFSAEHGLWMLPRGQLRIDCATWVRARFNEFVELELLRHGSGSRNEWIDVVVALVPRPDNEYNPKAISIAQPITYGGSYRDRHMAFVYDADHGLVGGDRFHDLAEAAQAAEIGCHARLRAGQADGELQLWVSSPGEALALIDDFLSRREDRTDGALVTAVPGMDHIPPARAEQAVLLEAQAENHVRQWRLDPPADVSSTPLRVQQQSVFGNHLVYVVNQAGGRIGQLKDEVLFLDDERHRRAALDALERAGIPQHDAVVGDWFPDAVLVHRGARWLLKPRGAEPSMGWYDPETEVLHVHADAYREPAEILLRRHGIVPVATRWAAPDPEQFLRHLGVADRYAAESRRASELAEQQVWRMWARHRDVFPNGLADLSPLRWTDEKENRIFAEDGTYWLHHDSYYLRDVESLFGPHDHGEYRHGQKPVPCRLCGRDALTATRRAEPGAKSLAYCSGCARKAVKGFLVDRGCDESWEPLAVWCLQQLAAELGGPPSQAQIPRLVSTVEPAAADRAMLIRMHVPRARVRRAVAGAEQRAPLIWADWLKRAGLLGDGVQLARGTVTVASDGHLCRSLLERHIDDFLTANGIAHEVEPYWPYDPDLNTTGLRADWLLDDGTYVEAWGLPDEPAYASKMERKVELAARTGIRLVGVTSADLGNLHNVFASWIIGEPRPVPSVVFGKPDDPRLQRPRKPGSPAPRATNPSANAETRAARLERCRRAVALQEAGMNRAAIGAELGMGPDAVKALLRDGKFYAAPDSDPARRQLAVDAHEAQSRGMTKDQFRQARALAPPKAHECWKDADVLFERHAG